jgi:hypothetical protein
MGQPSIIDAIRVDPGDAADLAERNPASRLDLGEKVDGQTRSAELARLRALGLGGHALRQVAGRDRACRLRHALDRAHTEPQHPEHDHAQDPDHDGDGGEQHPVQSAHGRVDVAQRDADDVHRAGHAHREHAVAPRSGRARCREGVTSPHGGHGLVHGHLRRATAVGGDVGLHDHPDLAVHDLSEVDRRRRDERRRGRTHGRSFERHRLRTCFHELAVDAVDEVGLGGAGDDVRHRGQHERHDHHAGDQAGAQRHLRLLLPQRVPEAPHGLDEAGVDVVDLLPQVADVGLDHTAIAAEVVLPHVVEDLRLRQHAALVGE